MHALLLLMILISSAVSQGIFDRRNRIETSSGIITGTRDFFNGLPVNAFLGVPYAQPPVGDLRFQMPRELQTRGTPRNANQMPAACIQYSPVPFPWYDQDPGKSEDCLYLNIWSPTTARASNRKAVMFYVHGGAFTLGSNRQAVYNGRALAGKGDVIVVTINYRLGAFGFLTSGTNAAPGNVGLYDVLEALKWVRKNIGAFGGNPERITVFGESAGSIITGMLVVSPLAKGMIHRIIMQSGSPTYLIAENNTANIDLSQRLADAVGCASDANTIQANPEEVVSCLRGIPAENLARTLNSFNPTSSLTFIPSYGDSFLPQNPRVAIMNGNFQDVDVMIGNTRDEGSVLLTAVRPEVFGDFGEKNPQINKTFGESLIRQFFRDFSDPEAVVQHYLGRLNETDYDMVRRQVYTAYGDFFFLCPDVYFAESYARRNRVYFYFFVHRPSNTPWAPWMGVAHFEDVQFVFGRPMEMSMNNNYTALERAFSEDLVKTWAMFARNGRPSPTTIMTQTTYSRENPQFTNLNTTFSATGQRTGLGPHLENCNFFRPYFEFD